MRHAVIFNGKVVNVIIINPQDLSSITLEADLILPVENISVQIGDNYIDGEFVSSEEETSYESPPPVWESYIDIGPFFDRFGAVKMQVLTCSDAGVKAILQDVSIRKWIDLRSETVEQSLLYCSSVIPTLTPSLISTILTPVVQDHENLALRKLFFQ